MLDIFRKLAHSKFIVIITPSIVFLGFFIMLKFFFIIFSDRHELQVSPTSDKIIEKLRRYRNKESKNKPKVDIKVLDSIHHKAPNIGY